MEPLEEIIVQEDGKIVDTNGNSREGFPVGKPLAFPGIYLNQDIVSRERLENEYFQSKKPSSANSYALGEIVELGIKYEMTSQQSPKIDVATVQFYHIDGIQK